MKTKRILFIHHLAAIGGATKSLLGLATHLKDQGYEVIVLFYSIRNEVFDWFEDNEIKCISFPQGQVFQHAYGAYIPVFQAKAYRVLIAFYRAIKSIKSTRNIIKKVNPDLVYLNTSLLFPAAIASKCLDVRVIWHLREQLHNGHIGIRKAWLKWCYKMYADEIVAISKTNAEILGPSIAKVVYNSTSNSLEVSEDQKFEFRLIHSIPKKRIIAFLGGKVGSKGGDLMVEAFISLYKKRSDIVLVVAGEFNFDSDQNLNLIERNVYKLICENNGLSGRLIFTGALKDVRPLLSEMEILVWPATTPHFSRPIMEAMMMGKAIVASDYKSSREILEPNKDGLLVQANAAEIAKAIELLLDDPETAQQYAASARQKALKLFDETMNHRELIEIVNQQFAFIESSLDEK